MSSSTSPLPLDQTLGRLAVRRYGLCVALVLVLMAWNVFAGLGSVAINDSDEARYGVSAWEMLQNRSFVVTTYAGEREYWNLKPPLGYWMMALSFSLFGPTPFAMRFPSALCALAAVAVAMAVSRRWLGRRASLLTGLFFATTYGFLTNHGARAGDLDSALTLLLLVATFEVSRLGRSPWRAVSLAALLGTGFLLKSFAILPLIITAGLYLAWSGDWRRLRIVPCLVALLAFALPVGAWAVARVQADGGSTYFLERMVREDLFARSTSIVDKVTYSPYNYVGALFDRFAPWPLLILIAAVLAAREGGLQPLARRLTRGRLPLLLLWVLVPLVLFSVSRTQHHWYLDPSYPAWAMLGALAVLDLLRRASPERRRTVLMAAVLVPLTLCEVRVLYRTLLAERSPESQRFLASLAAHRLELGPELRTGPLLHSERFILEAMDGFRVEEVTAEAEARRPADRAAEEPPSVLIAKGTAGPRPQPPLGSGVFLENRDYLLFQSASQIAGRTARSPRHGRGHIGRRPRLWRPRSRVYPT
jgi:4-amino-4-deoxy-L-arabinose transferase-like glycosyltransferase